jgi:hypothetical protein
MNGIHVVFDGQIVVELVGDELEVLLWVLTLVGCVQVSSFP